jgi:hypothetical protein
MTVDEIFEIAGKGTVLVVVPNVGLPRVGDTIQVMHPITRQYVSGIVSGIEQHVHRNCFGGNHPDAGAILTTLDGPTIKGAIVRVHAPEERAE